MRNSALALALAFALPLAACSQSDTTPSATHAAEIAWREGDVDYATVAMRYESIDYVVDRQSGKLINGDDQNPSESTEVWTFVRRPGADWQISAIQAVAQYE